MQNLNLTSNNRQMRETVQERSFWFSVYVSTTYPLPKGLDLSRFGKDDAKTLYEFAQEIARGQCYLVPSEDGKTLIRVVDVVLLHIKKADGSVLLETCRTNERSGKTKRASGKPRDSASPAPSPRSAATR